MSDRLPTQLKVLQDIREVPRAAWNALLTEQSTPFLDWAWLEALESTGCAAPKAGWHPRHLTLWRGNRLIAAAPAYLKDDSVGEFVYDYTWATAAERIGFRYYPKLVLAVPFSPATGERLLVAPSEDRAARQEELVRGALELARAESLSGVHVLFHTAEESKLLERLGFGIRNGVQYHWHNHGYRSFDDFLAELTSKRRHQLKRERRGPSGQGITVRTLRGEALSSVSPGEVFRIYLSTIEKYPWGRKLLNERFFARVLETLPGQVEFVEARRDGALVAGAFNLASPKVLYGRYWGCFEELPFLHFNVCLYHPVEEAIARGLTRFEPGAGGEHKLVRGFLPQVTYSAHWLFQPTLDRAVRNFLDTERAAIATGLPQWRREAGFKGGS